MPDILRGSRPHGRSHRAHYATFTYAMPRRVLLAFARLGFALLSVAGCVAQAFAQGGTIAGIATTAMPAMRPLRVMMDTKVCGAELPDEAAHRNHNYAFVYIAGTECITANGDKVVPF